MNRHKSSSCKSGVEKVVGYDKGGESEKSPPQGVRKSNDLKMASVERRYGFTKSCVHHLKERY